MDIDEFLNNYTSLENLLNNYLIGMGKKYRYKPSNDCLTIYKKHSLYFEKGELIVLASRPSIGKTVLALNWGLDFALKQKKAVGFITSGIPNSEYLTLRLLSLESKLSPVKIRNCMLSKTDINMLQKASSKLLNLPIFISDIPNAKFEDIENVATEMVSKKNIEILFIDGFEYFYEIIVTKTFWDDIPYSEDMMPYYYEISNMIEKIKELANKLKIPIVLIFPINQPKRGYYLYEPTLISLKDKLIIPKLADKIIFLHRNSTNENDEWQQAKLIVAKDNNNSSFDIYLEFNCKTGEFRYKE